MRRLWLVGIFIVIISFTFAGCSDSENADTNNNANNNENNENEEVEADNENENENDENNEPEDENNENINANHSDANEEDNEEVIQEETFADEVTVMDVDKVQLDEEAERFDKGGADFIEYDDLRYVEQEFITDLLDYELTYDEENTVAEIYDEKGDFKYEPSHRKDGGAIMDTGQIYEEDQDEYVDIPNDSSDLYNFIEYKGKLYVPERIVNSFMKEPIHYVKRDKIIEIGLQSEATDIYDVDLDGDSSTSAEVTKDASDVTIEGENYEGGVVISDVNSAEKAAVIDTTYEYSEINGFIHNKSDDDTIEIKFSYDKENIIETIELEPEETKEFDYEVKGEELFYIDAKGVGGGSAKAVIVGELK